MCYIIILYRYSSCTGLNDDVLCAPLLQAIKQRILDLEEKVRQNKKEYHSTMKHLEVLSENIHAQRQRSTTMTPAISEPSLAQLSLSAPLERSRKAITPDLKRRNIHNDVHRKYLKPLFTGANGSLPTVSGSPITAQPSSAGGRDLAKQVVTMCLSRALTRYQEEEEEEGEGRGDSGSNT